MTKRRSRGRVIFSSRCDLQSGLGVELLGWKSTLGSPGPHSIDGMAGWGAFLRWQLPKGQAKWCYKETQ